MLDISIKINPSLEEVALKAIKDALKSIDPSAMFVKNPSLSPSDEARFLQLLEDKKAGKIEYVSSDELWSGIDNIIAKYE